MIEIVVAFIAGTLAGYWSKPKNPELEDQKKMYDIMYKKYADDVQYYKDLCKWHVERKSYDQEKNG